MQRCEMMSYINATVENKYIKKTGKGCFYANFNLMILGLLVEFAIVSTLLCTDLIW